MRGTLLRVISYWFSPIMAIILGLGGYWILRMDSGNLMSLVKELQGEHIVIRDGEEFENKLKNLVADGIDKLQVITDFDWTLTKSVVDGKPTSHTLDIFSKVETLSQTYRDGCTALLNKYEPQVSSPELTEAHKQDLLNQWWDYHEKLMVSERFTVTDIKQATDTVKTPLRDGCGQMLSLLTTHQVPLVVVSAGLGDIIEHVLQDYKPRIVSNYIKFDKEVKPLEFIKPTVSVYNKHRSLLPIENDRHNVLLLGDSLGDCNMADNVANTKTVLKIGFLTDWDDKKLEKYRNSYDLVLVDDQTMETVTALLKLILGSS